MANESGAFTFKKHTCPGTHLMGAYGTQWLGHGQKKDSSYAQSTNQNPEAAGPIQTNMILAIAFAEAIAIYALVVAILIKFV